MLPTWPMTGSCLIKMINDNDNDNNDNSNTDNNDNSNNNDNNASNLAYDRLMLEMCLQEDWIFSSQTVGGWLIHSFVLVAPLQ